MNNLPIPIQLLIKLWDIADRFVPDGVTGSHTTEDGVGLLDREWTWDGGKDQGHHDVHLELFHNWTAIQQQELLEAAVGKIFSVMSSYYATVVQMEGTKVAVKHREAKEVRRFRSQNTLLANLFNALIKMHEVGWLPRNKAKDGSWCYTENERERVDHFYELGVLKEAKVMLEKELKGVGSSAQSLPKGDPFADIPYFMTSQVNADVARLKARLDLTIESIKKMEHALDSMPVEMRM